MQRMQHQLRYILTGASGSGKSTMGHILEDRLGLRRCITSTTRPPRTGETHGVDYYFEPTLDPTKLFEHAVFGSHTYGITWDELTKGDFIILEPQGVDYYRTHYPNQLTVIQLQRDGIDVDPDRMARDHAAGFDLIHPDVIVRGETIEEMASNLIQTIHQINHPPLDQTIRNAHFRIPSQTPTNEVQIPTR